MPTPAVSPLPFHLASGSSSSGADLSGTIGVALAENTLNNSVLAFIDGSDVHVPNGSLDPRPPSPKRRRIPRRLSRRRPGLRCCVPTLDVVRQLRFSGSITGAGSSATNNIDNTIKAYITGSRR